MTSNQIHNKNSHLEIQEDNQIHIPTKYPPLDSEEEDNEDNNSYAPQKEPNRKAKLSQEKKL